MLGCAVGRSSRGRARTRRMAPGHGLHRQACCPAGTDGMSHPFTETPGGVGTVRTAVPGAYRYSNRGMHFVERLLLSTRPLSREGDYPSEVTHSPWPQRFQSSREILRFGVTNYQRSKKAYFPWAWLLLRSYLPSLLVAGRALTGTLAKERCLLAIGVPSSATAAGRKPSSFWAAVPGPPGSEDVHRGCDSW